MSIFLLARKQTHCPYLQRRVFAKAVCCFVLLRLLDWNTRSLLKIQCTFRPHRICFTKPVVFDQPILLSLCLRNQTHPQKSFYLHSSKIRFHPNLAQGKNLVHPLNQWCQSLCILCKEAQIPVFHLKLQKLRYLFLIQASLLQGLDECLVQPWFSSHNFHHSFIRFCHYEYQCSWQLL